MTEILSDIDRIIMPAMTHWNHPNFFAYFSSVGSKPGILAEFLSAALNINGMLWKSCPAATELEQVTTGWVQYLLALPEDFFGVIYDTASTSTLHAMAAAREQADPLLRTQGAARSTGAPILRLYVSDQAHSSVEKAALLLGIGMENIRKIATDNRFAMNPDALQKAIADDRTAGLRPFCVVATIGTTSTTAIDPVAEIAAICREQQLWLHVDAAYAGSAAMLDECKSYFQGWETADSIVVNPHKWMFVPLDSSLLFTRHPDVLRRTFSLVPEYLRTEHDEQVVNFMDYGIPLGRRFRALKLWFVLRYFGASGLKARLREQIALAKNFAAAIDAHPDFQRMAPVPFSTVAFRARPASWNNATEEQLNRLNAQLFEAIHRSGRVFLSHTIVRGQFILRLAIGQLRTQAAHVETAWHLIQNTLAGILAAEGDTKA